MDDPCISFRLRRLTRRVTAIYDRHLADAGLKGTQFSLLRRIDKHGPLGTVALAAGMGMDRSTLSRNLRPLMQAGLVAESVAGADKLGDKRAIAVEITPQGKERLAAAVVCWRAAQREVTALMGTGTRDELMQSLETAYQKLRQSQTADVPAD